MIDCLCFSRNQTNLQELPGEGPVFVHFSLSASYTIIVQNVLSSDDNKSSSSDDNEDNDSQLGFGCDTGHYIDDSKVYDEDILQTGIGDPTCDEINLIHNIPMARTVRHSQRRFVYVLLTWNILSDTLRSVLAT